ncbi:esterase/lipase family protein [Corynebacterium striatum]|uniref:esterase/lipase family protein n=1 Tax=Corynebacterium striatum TaxID=43770 RepID=UPI003F7CEB8D
MGVMATESFKEPLKELEALISEGLGRFWRSDPTPPSVSYDATEGLPETPAAEQVSDSPRHGITTPAPANALREEVADEIAELLRAERRSFFDLDFRHPRGSAGDDHEAETAARLASLPLGARLKPRGVFEDDWAARPDEDHPWPIILIHGTTDTKGVWQLLGSELREDGWAVFAPDYGARATGPIAASADQVGACIDAVQAVTGAEQVVLIGHSQGGIVARYWMHNHDAVDRVRHIICLSAPNHGTTQGGIVSSLISNRRQEHVMRSIIDAYFGPAGMEQIVGSATLNELNHNGDLAPGVSYTCVATKQDSIVVPPETCFLDPGDTPDGTVRNVYVQDVDKRAVVLHMDMPMDKRVRAIVRTVLKQLSPTQDNPNDAQSHALANAGHTDSD